VCSIALADWIAQTSPPLRQDITEIPTNYLGLPVGTTCTGHQRFAITQIANGGSVNIGNIGAPEGHREATAAVATPVAAEFKPIAAARLMADTGQPSQEQSRATHSR
jgi:hypothetical protein